jgi:hypothetical protein
LNSEAQQNISLAQSNTLTPSQQANINEYIQNSTNQLYQQLASEGVTNPNQDSRYLAGLQNIQQQAQTMIQSYVNQTFSEAMSEAGQAANDLSTAANAQTSADNAYTQSLSQSIAAIGGMYGLSSFGSNKQAA